jgi:hypothetical protein
MVSAFAAGFVGRLGEISDEKRAIEAEREARMEALMEQRKTALIPALIKRQQSRSSLGGEYTNSVSALRTRLVDSEGELLPGANKLLENPVVAHKVYESIREEEKRAADNPELSIKRFTGQDILDFTTAYSSETGEVEIVPDISFEDMLTGNFDLEEGYQVAYGGSPEPAEPVVEFRPQVKLDPKKFEPARDIWKSRTVRSLDQAIIEARENNPAELARLMDIKESFERDPDGPAMSQVEDEFGAQVYRDMLEEGSEFYYELDKDPFFAPLRDKLKVSPDIQPEPSVNESDIAALQAIIADPNAEESDKEEARELLSIISGK